MIIADLESKCLSSVISHFLQLFDCWIYLRRQQLLQYHLNCRNATRKCSVDGCFFWGTEEEQELHLSCSSESHFKLLLNANKSLKRKLLEGDTQVMHFSQWNQTMTPCLLQIIIKIYFICKYLVIMRWRHNDCQTFLYIVEQLLFV